MRKFSPRELNWLKKYGVSLEEAGKFGEMPVEYIAGRAEFRGREFFVTPDVLIPRIETEQLVDEAKNIIISYSLLPTPYSISIADIGTGCGCIGITLYLEMVKLGIRPTVYVSDISQRALEVAGENISKVIPSELKRSRDLAKRSIITIKSDLFENFPGRLKFDLIVTNLPYVSSGRRQSLPESVRKFEPKLAIDGGKDGTILIKRLILQSTKRLFKGGIMVLEIDETHSEKTFENEIKKNFRSEIIKDQFGRNRFLILYKK